MDIHELYDHVYESVRAEGAQEPMKWDIHAKGRMIIAKSGRDAKEELGEDLADKEKDNRNAPASTSTHNLWRFTS